MNLVKKIKPVVLQKLDNYLLTHYPIIWQTKIHWIAFYSLGLFGLFYIFGDVFDYEPKPSVIEPLDRMGRPLLYDGRDPRFFGTTPSVLAVLVVFFWLYTQSRHKLDYSRLRLKGFMAITWLNYTCLVLIFLPVWGLALSTQDISYNLYFILRTFQSLLFCVVPLAVLPFIIRHFSIIEIILVVFAGVIYCILMGIGLSIIDRELFDQMPVIFAMSYACIGWWVIQKFKAKTFQQNTKRLSLFLVLALPLVIPVTLYWIGYFRYLRQAYSLLTFRHSDILLSTGAIALLLVLYGLTIGWLHKAMEEPMRKK